MTTNSSGFTPEPGQDPVEQQGHPGPGSQGGFDEEQGHPGPGSQSGTGGQPDGDRGGLGDTDDQHAGRPDADGLGDRQDRQRLEESQDEGFGGTQPERDEPA